MHEFDLILTASGGLTAAVVLGYLSHRLGLSPIVGYLLAGMVVGPHTPGFAADAALAEQLAEIGVILLMFGVGLQFHLSELLAVQRIAVPGAIAQSLVATGLGACVAHAFGWDWTAGIVFGLALSVASTVVLVRVLSDSNDLHTPAGHSAVGWLVVEAYQEQQYSASWDRSAWPCCRPLPCGARRFTAPFGRLRAPRATSRAQAGKRASEDSAATPDRAIRGVRTSKSGAGRPTDAVRMSR